MKTTPNRAGKGMAGFTIVELMVVISIMLVALVIGIPTYNVTIKPTAQLKAASRKLYSDIQQARMQAIRENVRYGLAFYSGPDRYRVFVDNGPANGQYDGGERVVKTITLRDEYGFVQFDTSCGPCGGDGVTFANDAFALTTRGLASNGGAVYLKNEKDEGRSVAVNTMGSIQIAEYTP